MPDWSHFNSTPQPYSNEWNESLRLRSAADFMLNESNKEVSSKKFKRTAEHAKQNTPLPGLALRGYIDLL